MHSPIECHEVALVLELKLRQVWRGHRDALLVAPSNSVTNKIVELHHIATLVYLLRLSDCLADRATKIHQLVQAGFGILRDVGTCQWPFPLLILGCEASSDEARMEIMDIIQETVKSAHARDLQCVSDMLRLSWVHQGLAVSTWHYADMMSAILSTSDIVPTFV